MACPKYVVELFFPLTLRLVKSSLQGPEDDSINLQKVDVKRASFIRTIQNLPNKK